MAGCLILSDGKNTCCDRSSDVCLKITCRRQRGCNEEHVGMEYILYAFPMLPMFSTAVSPSGVLGSRSHSTEPISSSLLVLLKISFPNQGPSWIFWQPFSLKGHLWICLRNWKTSLHNARWFKALYTGMQRGYAVGIKILVRCSLIYSWKFIHPLMHVRCIPVPELLLLVCVSCIVI